MAMNYEQYQNKRSWLIDTAETPADKKKLASELAKLDAQWQAIKKAKGTQSGHAVTSGKSTTKPLTPAEKQANAKRPAVGNDAAVAKKVNGPSWNNGYTN